MKIAIFGRSAGNNRNEAIRKLYLGLHQRNVAISVYEPFLKITRDLLPENVQVSSFRSRQDISPQTDCMITLGGDGTLLEAITHVGNAEIPVLGINTGRLGFLTGFTMEETDLACEMAVNQSYLVEKRSLIQINTPEKYFGETPFSLNEVTFHKRDNSSMITLHVEMNGKHVNSYWGDGLIISTPTGSTGYSLSCGGPIMMPDAQNLIIAPIAPHNLNVRPLVIPDSCELNITAEVRGKNFMVSLDSRSAVLPAGESVIIKKAGFQIHLVRKPERAFLQTLREKLMWGIDRRN